MICAHFMKLGWERKEKVSARYQLTCEWAPRWVSRKSKINVNMSLNEMSAKRASCSGETRQSKLTIEKSKKKGSGNEITLKRNASR